MGGKGSGARHKSEKRRERGHPARCQAVKKPAPLQRFFSQLHSGRDPDESGRAGYPRSVRGIGFHFYVAHPKGAAGLTRALRGRLMNLEYRIPNGADLSKAAVSNVA